MSKLSLILSLLLLSTGFQKNQADFKPIKEDVFSAFGQNWEVKRKSKHYGPGPNLFGQSDANVMFDDKGDVLLQIEKNEENQWSCAEIISENEVGYGDYWLHVEADVAKLNRQVVFGFFTYDHNNPPTHSEIDVEISRWGKSKNENAQFAFYVDLDKPVLHRFKVDETQNTHVFLMKRRPSYTQYFYFGGKNTQFNPNKAGDHYFKYEHTKGHYAPTREKLHLNLWLFRGKSPRFSFFARDRKVLVKNIQYIPYSKKSNSIQ